MLEKVFEHEIGFLVYGEQTYFVCVFTYGLLFSLFILSFERYGLFNLKARVFSQEIY